MTEVRDLSREVKLAELRYKGGSLQYTLRERARYKRQYRELKKEMER